MPRFECNNDPKCLYLDLDVQEAVIRFGNDPDPEISEMPESEHAEVAQQSCDMAWGELPVESAVECPLKTRMDTLEAARQESANA